MTEKIRDSEGIVPSAGPGRSPGASGGGSAPAPHQRNSSLWNPRTLRICAALLCLSGVPAEAQQRAARPAQKAPEKEAPPTPEQPAPYDRDLMRLSEIIGSLAFLRGLCAAPDAAEWQSRMKALIEAEGVTQNRRDRLAGAFNRGYRAYAVTYRICTPAAQEAVTRFVAEGERLSHTLAGRFGG